MCCGPRWRDHRLVLLFCTRNLYLKEPLHTTDTHSHQANTLHDLCNKENVSHSDILQLIHLSSLTTNRHCHTVTYKNKKHTSLHPHCIRGKKPLSLLIVMYWTRTTTTKKNAYWQILIIGSSVQHIILINKLIFINT